MYQRKDKKPCKTFRHIKGSDVLWYDAFQVGNEYMLTWRDIEDQGGWIAFRNNLSEVLKLIPQDAEELA